MRGGRGVLSLALWSLGPLDKRKSPGRNKGRLAGPYIPDLELRKRVRTHFPKGGLFVFPSHIYLKHLVGNCFVSSKAGDLSNRNVKWAYFK